MAKGRVVFGDGFKDLRPDWKPVTLGQFRAVTAGLPDDTPLTYNDDGRSDEQIGVICVSVERRVKVNGVGPAVMAVAFEA